MTKKDFQYNLKELREYEGLVQGISRFASRNLVDSYEDFISVLYQDIDDVVSLIEENPELRRDDGEDRLTIEFKNILCGMGYNASHDTKIGGHTDLAVRKEKFIWLGEAKVHNSLYDYLWEGFLQLCTRYSIGGDNQSCGGLIVYIRTTNSASVMKNWKSHLENKKLPDCKILPCNLKKIAFFSTHTHEKSGLPFEVRHIPLMLYFSPQDKSGRNRKNR